jgi:hypothetical protein
MNYFSFKFLPIISFSFLMRTGSNFIKKIPFIAYLFNIFMQTLTTIYHSSELMTPHYYLQRVKNKHFYQKRVQISY